METIVRANEDSLRDLKIGSHRSRASSTSTLTSTGNQTSQTDLHVVRLEEYVVNKSPKKGWVLPFFVIMGIGLNMPFAALNGATVYFSDMFGPTYYLNFLAAFNIPAIPLLTAQLLWDEKIDKRFGSRITFSFRLITTFLIMTVCTVMIPFMVHSFLYVIILISAIGIANGIAFGSMFQLGAIFSNKGTACIFAGLGLGNLFTTVVILLLDFNRSAEKNTHVVTEFFRIHAGGVIVGILAIIFVMFTKPVREVLAEKDRISLQVDPDSEPLLSVNKDSFEDRPVKKKKTSSSWRTNLKVLKMTWKSQLAMFLTYFTGVTILSFLAYLPTVNHWGNGTLFMFLALYLNIYGDFFGKNLTLLPSPIKKDTPLLLISVLRASYLVYFFLYITTPDFPRNDYIVLGTMGFVALLGGYLTNLMFTIAPTTAPPKYKQQVASMVTLVLHLAVYSAIGVSYLLTNYLHFVAHAEVPQK